MNEVKFKKGDKVRLIYLDSMDEDTGLEINQEFTVDQDGSYVPWCLTDCRKTYPLRQSKLELVVNIQPLTASEFEIIKIIAEEKGIRVCRNWIKQGFLRYPYIHQKVDAGMVSGTDCVEVAISFIEFMNKIDSIEVKLKSVELNSNYTAEIHDGYVTVGCQNINFNKITELYNAIKK